MTILTILQIVFVIILLLFIFVYSFWRFSFMSADCGLGTPLAVRDYISLIIIIVFYGGISFYHLGALHSKGMWYGDRAGKVLQINLPHPQAVQEIKLYGCVVTGAFELSYIDEAGQAGKFKSIDNSKVSATDCTWLTYPTNLKQKIKVINLTISKPLLEVMRVYLKSYDGKLINAYQPAASVDANLDNMDGLFYQESEIIPDYKNTGMLFDENDYALMGYHYLTKTPVFNHAHPQLGMLLPAVGIALFGMNPFGWRIMSVLAGIFLSTLLYIFAKKISGSRFTATIAAFLISIDFMHFTINRLAVIEPFVTLFVLMLYYFLWQYTQLRKVNIRGALGQLFLCLLCLGLAISTKWTGIFSILTIIPVILITEAKNFHKSSFTVLLVVDFFICAITPFVIYIATYIPFGLIAKPQNFLETVCIIQQWMFDIHTKLAVSFVQHGQPWWSWPLDKYLMSIYFRFDHQTLQSTSLVFMGNPLIWWFGIPSVIILIMNLAKTKNKSVAFILLMIAAQYLPYVLVKRVSFIYYFYTVTPFWILAIAETLHLGWLRSEKIIKLFILSYLSFCFLLFIFFYPVISGTEVSRIYTFRYLLWFKSWWF